MSIFRKFKGDGAAPPPRATGKVIWQAFLGSFVAIGVLAVCSGGFHLALLLGSFGASCGLIFGFPDGPFSQPRNIIGGHVLSTAVGLACAQLLGHEWYSVALAVGLAVALMLAAGLMHPPAGSNPVIVYLLQPGWSFLLFPTLVGAVILVLIALLFVNLTREARWPKFW
jgi:CBS-domain-containing membrane protein